MLPTAKRVVTWRTDHTPRALVDKLDFVTASGNMTALITPLAVFTREPQSGARFTLECWNDATTTDDIARHTGFAFDIAAGAKPASPITAREHQALTDLDPQGQFAATVRA